MKQNPKCDKEALRTLELLADTHRRKAKVLTFRIEYEGKTQGEVILTQTGIMRKEK